MQATFIELSTILVFLPVFALLPYDKASQLYSKALASLKDVTELTALVLAVPFALSVALLSIPL